MKTRLSVPAVATLGFFASICAGLVLIAQRAGLPFDAEVWRSSPSQRYRMTKALADGPLAGQTREEAVQILGEPNSTQPEPDGVVRLRYDLGRSGFDVNYLDVEVRDDKLTRATVRSD